MINILTSDEGPFRGTPFQEIFKNPTKPVGEIKVPTDLSKKFEVADFEEPDIVTSIGTISVENDNLPELTIDELRETRRVVCAMTSWTKRIQNCSRVIARLLEQTCQPDRIYLTLSVEEFPNKSADLPTELVKLTKSKRVALNWVDENTKTMKKVFPILKYLNDDDIILLCDDDMDFPTNFIEIRLNEFIHNKYMPISGGNNPQWHKNLNYCGIQFNMCTPSSLLTKRMLKRWDNYLTEDVIKTYHDDCVYTMILYANGYKFVPSRELCTCSGVQGAKIPVVDDVEPLSKTHGHASDEATVKIMNEVHKAVTGLTLKEVYEKLKRPMLFIDRQDRADDNAERLYQYIKDNYNANIYFVNKCLTRAETCRLNRLGFRLVKVNSDEYNKILESYNGVFCASNSQFARNNDWKQVFLQHGVCETDIDHYMESKTYHYDLICTSTTLEYEKFVEKFGNNHAKFVQTGLARFDELLTNELPSDGFKRFAISMTWRYEYRTLNGLQYQSTRYFRELNTILNHKKLANLCNKYGYKIVFNLHPNERKHLAEFSIPNHVEINTGSFKDMFTQCDFIITDQSSVSYDMAYLGKPTIYYHYDDRCVTGDGGTNHLDYENYGFGPIAKTSNELVQCIELAMTHDKKMNRFYKRLHERFFHVDTDNCKRIFEEILKLD